MPKAGEVWRHFKGNFYLVIAAPRHTETGEMYVVYKALYGTYEDYLRPLDMFMSEVDRVKYPDVKQKYRFEKKKRKNRYFLPESAVVHGSLFLSKKLNIK